MTWYVQVPRINGRINFYLLCAEFNQNGYGDRVQYFEGDSGWHDILTATILPHLKFEYEDDAVAYTLKYGGTATKNLPTLNNQGENHAL